MAETGRIHIDLTEELERNVTKAYEDMTQGLITVLGTTKMNWKNCAIIQNKIGRAHV